MDDQDYQVPFKFTGNLSKLTIKLDRPQLTPADEKRLMETERNNKMSEEHSSTAARISVRDVNRTEWRILE